MLVLTFKNHDHRRLHRHHHGHYKIGGEAEKAMESALEGPQTPTNTLQWKRP